MRMRFWVLAYCLMLAGCAAEHAAVREDARPEREVFLPAELQDWEGWSAQGLGIQTIRDTRTTTWSPSTWEGRGTE